MTRRWIIVVEAEDGLTNAYGSWTTRETAEHLAGKLREGSSAYNGDSDAPSYRVTLEWVERWPGLASALVELGVNLDDAKRIVRRK